ncbi:hypothetical protein D0Y65_036460 [Glycine soja]|uniref:Uncharacterized protein n=1 Tax=Glycine soja TaxID=3848 RepID=A0A445HEM9_GLYSO|nr:hypothetical protein D0Y65_036460 [Glycine soja]
MCVAVASGWLTAWWRVWCGVEVVLGGCGGGIGWMQGVVVMEFLPSDLSSNSMKALFFTLSDRPTIVDQATKSFELDKKTAKKCYMFSARDLSIECKSGNWTRTSARMQESRFKKVAWLPSESFFSIGRMINTGIQLFLCSS